MAISDSAKVDLLYKKYFGVTKTDTPANKSPSNESIASPLLLRGDIVWQSATSIPGTAAATPGIVQAYQTTGAIRCVADTTSTPVGGVYPSWKTNLTDWIPSEFGASYFIKVYADTAGVANPVATGTQLSDSGIGGVGEWNFDYSAGVLNFIGGTIPAALTGAKVIYITGYRYIGAKGVTNFANLTIGNIVISGNTITGNTDITFGGNISADYINGNYFRGFVIGSQPGIIEVGTLTELTVTANTHTGNILTDGFFYANGSPVVFSNYGNANVADYLPSYTGNIGAGNVQVTGNFYGNILADEITTINSNILLSPSTTGVTIINSETALRLPVGNDTARPDAIAGYIRYNSAIDLVEYSDGTDWLPMSGVITDQQLAGDGVNVTYTMDKVAASAAGIIVSINGTLQRPNVAYTVSGDQITFAEIPLDTDIIDIRFIASSVSSSVNSTVVDTPTVTVGTSNVVIDSFSVSLYRSAKYTISSTTMWDSQFAEVMVVQDSGIAVVNGFGVLNTGVNSVQFYVNTNGTVVNLIAQGTTSPNELRIQKTYFSK